MITLNKLDNGNLQIVLNDKEELEQMLTKERPLFVVDLLDASGYLGNGWDEIHPEKIGALTDSPIIGENVTWDDNGEIEHVENVWWFPNYMVEDWIETLLNEGSVIFTKAE